MNISFEFFPPQDSDANIRLAKAQEKLAKLNPEYFSVTFGAAGSSQDKTLDAITTIKNNSKIPPRPHISCVGVNKNYLYQLLQKYQQQNINKLVVLRGDIPSDVNNAGDFNYAYQLVEFIRDKFGDYFNIQVAAYPEKHPQAKFIVDDIEYFINKIKAGANGAITQYFYNIDAYFSFCDSVKKHTDIIITPGILPITNFVQLNKFSKFCGAQIPKWIFNKLEYYQDDLPSLRAFGYDVVVDMCDKLQAQGVDNFHFYTMNKADPSYDMAKLLQKNN